MTFLDRLGRSLFVALAVGLAWGIRGDFGHNIGAMYPGACLGLGWVFVSGSPALVARMPVIAALTALGIGAGGSMSYGILHGYAQADSFVNYGYGFLTLLLQGGCWGTFGGCLAGLMVERKPMRTGDWLGLVASVVLGGWLATLLVVDVLKFHVNPPRNDISVAFFGAAIGQFLWLAANRRSRGLRGAAFAFLGFGLGMAGGRLDANALVAAGVNINHWNVMEITAGFVGGGVSTFGMLGLGRLEPDEDPSLGFPNVLGALLVLGAIPCLHLAFKAWDKMDGWQATLTGYGYADAERISRKLQNGIVGTCFVAAMAGLDWAIGYTRGKRWRVWLPVMMLSFVMLVFQNITALYFWYPHRDGYWNTHNLFWVLFGLMAVYVLVARPGPIPEGETPVRWGRLLLFGTVVFALIVLAAGWTNGEKTMQHANTRWPVWSWSNGPFPGR